MLTKRQIEVLKIMRDEEEELVYERGVGYVGVNRISGATLLGLLRCAAISLDQFSEVGDFERYTINETGRSLIASCTPSAPPRSKEE